MLDNAKLIASAGCASIPGDGAHARQWVKAALELGASSALMGFALPLFLLLDLVGLFSNVQGSAYIGSRRGGGKTEAVYDRWLADFVRAVRRVLLGQRAGAVAASAAAFAIDKPEFLQMLMSAWHVDPVSATLSRDCYDAYKELAADRKNEMDGILKAWQGPRPQDGELWSLLGLAPFDQGINARDPVALVWGVFSSKARIRDMHEEFEHHALQNYIDADDPELTPDQLRRVLKLKMQRRKYFDLIKREPTDQDPFCGQPPLAALCREPLEQVIHAIINHEIAWLNNQPATRPHRLVHIHLMWQHGWRGAREFHRRVKSPPSVMRLPGREVPAEPAESREHVTYAATLKSVVGLILDDWRSALRGLPVRFHLHRGSPRHSVEHLGKPGPRWKHDLQQGVPPVPAFLTNLFRRHLLGQVGQGRPWEEPDSRRRMPDAGEPPPGSANWRCCVCLEHDLKDWGFVPSAAGPRSDSLQTTTDPLWIAPGGGLLAPLADHAIVIRDELGEAVICMVRRGDGGTELRPMPSRRHIEPERDPSFLPLRSRAIDLLLDNVEARMFQG